ncbi:MAG: hypothetical protein ACR2IH_06305 [Pyrinomonadaceae bacterium]
MQTIGRILTGAMALVLTLTLGSLAVFSQDRTAKGGNGNTLEGVWQINVTAVDCQTGTIVRTFRSLNTFMQGGTMVEDSSVSSVIRGTSHGLWQRTSGREYASTFTFFRFNPDGSPNGSQRVRRNIELSDSSDELTATATVEIYNVAGALVGAGCSIEAGTRFTF